MSYGESKLQSDDLEGLTVGELSWDLVCFC